MAEDFHHHHDKEGLMVSEVVPVAVSAMCNSLSVCGIVHNGLRAKFPPCQMQSMPMPPHSPSPPEANGMKKVVLPRVCLVCHGTFPGPRRICGKCRAQRSRKNKKGIPLVAVSSLKLEAGKLAAAAEAGRTNQDALSERLRLLEEENAKLKQSLQSRDETQQLLEKKIANLQRTIPTRSRFSTANGTKRPLDQMESNKFRTQILQIVNEAGSWKTFSDLFTDDEMMLMWEARTMIEEPVASNPKPESFIDDTGLASVTAPPCVPQSIIPDDGDIEHENLIEE